MKHKICYIIGIYLLMCGNLLAQKNLPLKFQEDVIKWSSLSWMDGQGKKDQLILMSSPPIIKEDTLYLFMNYYQKEVEKGKNYGYCGYIIKKLNKTTGQKYWETKRMYKDYGNRKILSQPRFTDKNLEIALYDESHKIELNTDWNECYPGHVTLDRLSGEIIDSNYIDKMNTDITRLRSFGNLFLGGDTPPTILKTDTGYIHLRQWLKEILSTKVDYSGVVVKVDSIKYPQYKYFPWEIRFEQVANDSFWTLMVTKTKDWTNMEVLLSKYSKNMVLDKTIDVSKYFKFPITVGGVYFIDRGYFVIGTSYIDYVDAGIGKYQGYLFDGNGVFKDSISYIFLRGETDSLIYGRIRPIVDRVHDRLFMTLSRQEELSESTYFDIYANEGDTTKLIKRIYVEGTTDHFRTEYATMLDNGDILMYISQFKEPSSSADRWYSWIMLDGQKMNIISSTTEDVLTENKLKIYPNPTTGTVYISHLASPATITISSMSGQVVKHLIDIVGEISIDDLSPGMYILDIRNRDLSERHKIIKVE